MSAKVSKITFFCKNIVFKTNHNNEMIIEVKCMVVYRVSRHKAAWLRAAQVTLKQ